MDHQNDQYWTAAQAADMLGISLPTLYAYVSRKGIRSVKVDGSRTRRYWSLDIERLMKGKGGDDSISTGAQRVATTCSITHLTDQGLFYRGQDAIELARSSATAEKVAELMWQVPDVFGSRLPKIPNVTGALLKLFEGTTAAEKAIALFPLIELDNPRAHDLTMEGYARTSADAVRWFAALVVGAGAPEVRPLHGFIASHVGVDSAFEDLIRQVLILSVDHERDPSTYCVRAAANTGVTPYYAAIAGLVSFRGRRVSYSRRETVSRLLEEICSSREPAGPILQRYRQGELLPGFGSSAQGVADPRAQHLLTELKGLFGADEDFLRLVKACEVAEEVTGQPVDFILLLSFVGRKLGLAGQEIAVAGVGRMIGWLAHASEQFHQQPMGRTHSQFVANLTDC